MSASTPTTLDEKPAFIVDIPERKMPECPTRVARAQRQGLTPAALEQYLLAGWPIRGIANALNLNVEDVLEVKDRWNI